MWHGHLQGLQGGKIQLGPQGYAHGPVCLLFMGWAGLVHPQQGKPMGCWWSSPQQRANSSGCVAASGSKVVGLLGAGTLINSSTLDLGDGALSTKARVMGSFLTTLNMLRSSRPPLSSRGVRHPLSFCTALQSIPGVIPEQMAHLWRAMASATISSYHITL